SSREDRCQRSVKIVDRLLYFGTTFVSSRRGYRCDRSSRTRSTRERRIINTLMKFFPSDLGSFQCSRHCAGQYKHRPEDGEDNYSESNQLRQIVGLRSVGIPIGDETADAHPPGCCVFHGFNAPFMRSRKLTTICTRALRLKSNAVVTFRRTNYIVSGWPPTKPRKGFRVNNSRHNSVFYF